MRIGLDAMGGDNAPVGIIDGAIEAVRERDGRIEVVLVGPERVVREYLEEHGYGDDHIEIVDAPETIGMNESPSQAIRRKKDSSIVRAMLLQKEGAVKAVVSAGSTGAAVVSSLFYLGRLNGIDRPAIALWWPTKTGTSIILDGGANADCTPRNLLQFAEMGAVYAEYFLGMKSPRVGLLSNGEESSKGNELTREAHALLAASDLDFAGNVEGGDVFEGAVDVVVTDGFTGNVMLKFSESVFGYFNWMIRKGVDSSVLARIGAAMMRPVFRGMKRKLDYAEYGGMPLLGVNGVTIIGHGGSSARAAKNAILAAERFVESGINEHIRARTEETGE
ncbi:MAG: phosphate acyltransferase PlsX [Candidatus Krumholzibacteriota bacterium]|nr:phosphate acyltransferase PlsX [Candidatus Krumholzibacteriota bacterium]